MTPAQLKFAGFVDGSMPVTLPLSAPVVWYESSSCFLPKWLVLGHFNIIKLKFF